MSELREALGDEPSAPQYIKTVARRGYRFIAEVTSSTTEDTAERIKPPVFGVLRGGDSPADDEPTIAVMDFTNVAGDAESSWLAAGIAETVTGDLRTLGRLRVVDRWRVSEAARRTDGSLERVAQDLHARLVVVGSYQRNGPRVRITARVVDVVSGEALADAKVDGPIDAIFALQDQVVEQFARELGVVRPGSPAARSPARETANLDAYRAFCEGWLRLESLDVRELPHAIAAFERAVAADPQYTLAYTGLASAELARYETTRSDAEPAAGVLHRAVGHARHAVHLDDSLAEAHATLAFVLVSDWRTEEAAAAARRAVALEPDNWRHLFRLGHASWGDERLRAAGRMLQLYPDFAFAHFQMAMVHVARGHLHEAEAVLRQGAAVQDRQIGRGGRYPALGLHWLLGLVRLAEDDHDEALQEFDRERTLAEPHRLYGREYAMAALFGRGAALLRAHRDANAAEAFAGALQVYPDHVPAMLGRGLARGDTADGPGTTKTLDVLSRRRPIEAALVRAQIAAVRGDVQGALDALGGMLDAAPPGFAGWTIPVEPLLRYLHEDERFGPVLTRLSDRAR